MRLLWLNLLIMFLSTSIVGAQEVNLDSIPELQSAIAREKDETQKFYLLTALVRKYAAEPLNTKFLSEVGTRAQTLLEMAPKYPKDWNYGNALHLANLVLGRIKLQQGKVQEAKDHLLAAGKTPGSPQLNSFGPNMTLAKELLNKGEKKVIFEYLDLCSKFWNSQSAKDKMGDWKVAIEAGKTPKFGANLVY